MELWRWPRSITSIGALVAALAGLVELGAIHAQEKPESAPAGPPAAVQTQPLAQTFWESARDKIIVILDDVEKIGGRMPERGRVSIPLAKLEEYLREKWAEQNRPQWSITSLDLTGTLTRSGASLEARLQIRVDHPGGATVALEMAEAQCEQASDAAGKWPYLDRRRADGPFQVLFERPGTYSIALKLWVPASQSPSERRLQLTLPPAAIKSVLLSSDDELAFVRHGKSGDSFELEANGKQVRPRLRPAESLDVAWRSKLEGPGTGSSLTNVRGVLAYRIEATAVRGEFELQLEGDEWARELVVVMPPAAQITGVTVRRGQTQVKCRPVETTHNKFASRVVIRAEEPLSGPVVVRMDARWERSGLLKEMEVGRLEMENTNLQNGTILVFSDSELLVRPRSGQPLRRVPLGQLDDRLQRQQPVAAFQYDSQPARVLLEVNKTEPVIRATAQTTVQVSPEHALVESHIRFSVTGGSTQSVRLRIPAMMIVDSIGPDSMVEPVEGPLVRTGSDRRAARTKSAQAESKASGELLIPLREPRRGDFEIVVRGTMPITLDQSNALQLPIPVITRGGSGFVEVVSARNVRLTLDSSLVRNMTRQPLPTESRSQPGTPKASPGAANTAARASPADSAPQDKPLWYFRHQEDIPVLAFTPHRLLQQVSADVDVQVRRTREGYAVSGTLRFQSVHEPMEHVVLQVPKGLKGLTIQGENQAGVELSGPGIVTFPLPNPSFRHELHFTYDFPTDVILKSAVRIPLVLPSRNKTSIGRFVGEIANSAAERISVVPPWTTLPREIGAATSNRSLLVGPVLADDYLSLQIEVAHAMAPLVVPHSLVRETVSGSGRRQGTMSLAVQVHRIDAATLSIPGNCRVSRVFVDGQEVVPVVVDDALLRIELPESDAPCTLEIAYEAAQSRSLGSWSFVALEPPSLVESPFLGETRWNVEMDPDWLVMQFGSHGQSSLLWRWIGILLKPESRHNAAALGNWLRSHHPELVFRIADRTDSVAGSASWVFTSWTAPVRLRFFCVREPLWILLASGVALVLGLILTRLPIQQFVRVIACGVVVIVSLIVVCPGLLIWLWLGGQWGAYLAAIALAGLASVRYRRWWRFRHGIVLEPLKAKPRSGSALISVRVEPGSVMTSSPSPSRAVQGAS